MKRLLMIAFLGVWGSGAAAHSPLEATVPAHEATIAEAPSELVMEFKGNIRLTRVSLTFDGQPSVDLDLEGFGEFASDFAIPLQPMGSGVYVIEWRGLGDDGHALNGSFSFTVQ